MLNSPEWKARLIKYGLLEEFEISLPITLNEFLTRFKPFVEIGDSQQRVNPFEPYRAHSSKYYGSMSHLGFSIRQRRKFLERSFGYTIVDASVKKESNPLVLQVKIDGRGRHKNLIAVFIPLFYLVALLFLFSVPFSEQNELMKWFLIIGLLLHFIFIVFVFFYHGRTSKNLFKEALLRDLKSISKAT